MQRFNAGEWNFFEANHNQTYTDIKVQMIDHSVPNNNKEFWIFMLQTLQHNGLC